MLEGNVKEITGVEMLTSLLFGEDGIGAVNIKFLPGSGRGVTVNAMCAAAANAIRASQARGLEDNPPVSHVRTPIAV